MKENGNMITNMDLEDFLGQMETRMKVCLSSCHTHFLGEYRHNKKHGKGTYTFGKGPWEGDSYSGDWQDDQKDGTGVYMWKVNLIVLL
jgi:hypothetical protein